MLQTLFFFFFFFFFFLSLEFSFDIMCHNPIRSIILESVLKSHRIVTHQVGAKFWKKSVVMSSISLYWVTILDLSTNFLIRKIPKSLCNSSRLIKLILFTKSLEGEIPKSLSSCKSLRRLHIQNNHLPWELS
jgi:hypothetical protein